MLGTATTAPFTPTVTTSPAMTPTMDQTAAITRMDISDLTAAGTMTKMPVSSCPMAETTETMA